MIEEIKEINEEKDINELKKEKKGKKVHKKKKKSVIILVILDILIAIAFFLTYGPISYFRDLLVTTSMTTMTHKYLARTLYTEDMINEVLKKNTIKDAGDQTNTSDIIIGDIKQTDTYDSIYEEQILKRDEDQDYKIVPLSGSGYKGYMAVIYDPAKVSLAVAPKLGTTGIFLKNLAKQNNAKVAINASGFLDPNEYGNGGSATGRIIKDGKLIWGGEGSSSGGLSGFNKNHVLVLTKDSTEKAIADGMMDAVEFGPFLVVNGKFAEIKGNGGWGIAPRTILAQRKDGIVLFIIIDGRQPGYSLGVDMTETIKILKRYNAHNAVNMDGGASSSLVINGETYSKPCGYSATGERMVPNGWIMK